MAEYTVVVRAPSGGKLTEIGTFESLKYMRAFNTIGGLELRLPDTYERNTGFDLGKLIQPDTRLEVWRTDNGRVSLEMDTFWLVDRYARKVTRTERSITIYASDLMTVLARRHVIYKSGTAYAKKTAPADNMIKAIFRENLGTLVTDANRNLSAYIGVQPDLSLSPSIEKAFAWRNVLTVMQEIAESVSSAENVSPSFLTFDLFCDDNGQVEFRTYTTHRGTDRRSTAPSPVTLDIEMQTLLDSTYEVDYREEFNHVTVGGQEVGENRHVATAESLARQRVSPFHRIEVFADARNQEMSDAALAAEAQSVLRLGRPSRRLSGTLQTSETFQYGRDFGYGDTVTAKSWDAVFNCRLSAMSVEMARGLETIKVVAQQDELL